MSAPEQAPEAIGSVIAGRFRIERALGEGGMAEVFQAHDLAANRPVAIKLLKKDIAGNAEAVERLRREGEVLDKLQHPGVVKLETFGKLEDGRLFIAMEMLTGETLGDRMRRAGRLDPADLSPIIAGSCAGLAAAHDAGIVHRDLKPDNIFLVETDGGLQVKLLDFGISKVTGSDKLTQTGEVVGTPRYMAPEQLSAERDLDGRTDVYALGVILYEALAGSPPFIATTPTDLIVAILHGKAAALRSFRPDLAGDVETVVTRAMSKAREARYADARELADAWLSAAGTGGVPVAAEGEVSSPRPGMRTAPLGSLGEEASSLLAGGGDPNDDVRPGTFSALAATESAGAAVPVVDAAAALPPSASPAVPPGGRPSADSPVPAPAADAGSTVPAKNASRPVARSRGPERTADFKLPTSGGRTLVIIAGIVAGALSAAIAIALLRGMSDGDEEPAESPAASAASADAPPAELETLGLPSAAAEPVPEPEGAAEGDGAQPADRAQPPADEGGETDPEAPDEEPSAAAPAPRRHRRPRSARGTAPSPVASPAADTAADSSPAALMRQARTALREGDPARCVEIVDRAIEAGAPSTSLRLRGDCLVRVGDRAEAVKAYERFCRLAPDHPAISEVRAVVEGLGGRCN